MSLAAAGLDLFCIRRLEFTGPFLPSLLPSYLLLLANQSLDGHFIAREWNALEVRQTPGRARRKEGRKPEENGEAEERPRCFFTVINLGGPVGTERAAVSVPLCPPLG